MLDRYVAPVRLLLDTLQSIDNETVFTCKGGTAISLFYRDMPRLSDDIDLTCLPVADRQSSLKDIDAAPRCASLWPSPAATRKSRGRGRSDAPLPFNWNVRMCTGLHNTNVT